MGITFKASYLASILMMVSVIQSASQTYKLQQGVCFTKDEVEIRGYFLDDNSERTSSKILFRDTPHGTTQELLPEDHSKIILDIGAKFFSYYDSVNRRHVFAREIESGSASLYKYTLDNQLHLIVEKGESRFWLSDYKINDYGTKIKSGNYRGVLNYVLGSSKDAAEKIKRTSFREVEIRDIVYRYNKSKNSTIERSGTKSFSEFEVAGGFVVNSNEVNSKFAEPGKSTAKMGVSISGRHKFMLDRRSKFGIGLAYHQFPSTLRSKEMSSSVTALSEFTINTLELPLQFEFYFFRKKQFSSSFIMGVNGGLVMQERYKRESSLASRSGTYKLDLGLLKHGYNFGVAIEYKRLGFSILHYTSRFAINGEQGVVSTGIQMMCAYRLTSNLN